MNPFSKDPGDSSDQWGTTTHGPDPGPPTHLTGPKSLLGLVGMLPTELAGRCGKGPSADLGSFYPVFQVDGSCGLLLPSWVLSLGDDLFNRVWFIGVVVAVGMIAARGGRVEHAYVLNVEIEHVLDGCCVQRSKAAAAGGWVCSAEPLFLVEGPALDSGSVCLACSGSAMEGGFRS